MNEYQYTFFNSLVPCFVVIISELLRKAGSKIFWKGYFMGISLSYWPFNAIWHFLGQLVQNNCLGKSLVPNSHAGYSCFKPKTIDNYRNRSHKHHRCMH